MIPYLIFLIYDFTLIYLFFSNFCWFTLYVNIYPSLKTFLSITFSRNFYLCWKNNLIYNLFLVLIYIHFFESTWFFIFNMYIYLFIYDSQFNLHFRPSSCIWSYHRRGHAYHLEGNRQQRLSLIMWEEV